MSRTWKYRSGDWNVICDVCGKKIKASIAKHRWDGYIVCPNDWEPRHEQDFVKAKEDKIIVDWTRPINTDLFINVTYTIPNECTKTGQTAVTGFAVSGCSITGKRM